MLSTLPAELVLSILQYLPLTSITSLQLASKQWKSFITTNASNIFRNAGVVHGFVGRDDAGLQDTLSIEHGERVGNGIKDWRDCCKRFMEIQHSWLGHAPSYVRLYDAFSEKRIHRIKIDEKQGLVIATSQQGGLTVADMKSGEVLWSLPESYVRPHAHCEYEGGYLIFDRTGGSKEIWRLSSLPPPSTPCNAQPDEYQLWVASLPIHHPYKDFMDDDESCKDKEKRKGHFTPHAHLPMPSHTRAYRFVFPHLLVASFEQLFIYDIPSCTLISTINNIQHPPMGDLNYVDISARHVFVATQRGIRVFEREGGRLVMDILSDKEVYGRRVHVDLHEGEESGFCCEGGFSSAYDIDEDEDEDEEMHYELDNPYENDSDEEMSIPGDFRLSLLDAYPHTQSETVDSSSASAFASTSRNAHETPPKRTWETRWGGRRAHNAMVVEHRVIFDHVPDKEENFHGRRVVDEFTAVHVSRDGKHLACLLSNSRLLLIHNFERAIPPPPSKPPGTPPSQLPGGSAPSTWQSPPSKAEQERRQCTAPMVVPLDSLTLDIQLGSCRSPSVYLAFENDRVGVVTQSAIWLVHAPPPPPDITWAAPSIPHPPIRINRIPAFNNPANLARISCLQFSPTGLYINWPPAPAGTVLTDDEWEKAGDREEKPGEVGGSTTVGSDDRQMRHLGVFGGYGEDRDWSAEEESGMVNIHRGDGKKRRAEERFERQFWRTIGDPGYYASTPQGDYIVLDTGIHVGVAELRQSTVASVEFVPRWDVEKQNVVKGKCK